MPRQQTTRKSKFKKSSVRAAFLAKGLLEVGTDNWLRVVLETTGQVVGLSKYTRADSFSFTGTGLTRRERFQILDWPFKNMMANVEALPDSRTRFGDVQYNVGAKLDYDYRTKILTVNPGNIRVKGGFNSLGELGNGTFKVFFADQAHDGTIYLPLTSYAKTWFHIDTTNPNDRYIHPGRVSLGCLTVGLPSAGGTDSDIVKWSDIAPLLLTQRVTGDEKYVGLLTIRNR